MTDAEAPTTGQTPTTDQGAAPAAPSLLDADSMYPSPQKPNPNPEDNSSDQGAQPATDDGAGTDTGEGEGDEVTAPDAGTEHQPGEGAGYDVDTEETISAINGWIEQLAADPEKASQIKVPVKVDGQPAEATISDLVKSYQIGEAAEKRLEKAKADAKALTDELTQQSQKLQGQFSTVAKLIEAAEKAVDRDAANIDWKALRADDPAEYSAKKAEFQERRQEIDKLKSEAVESYQTMTAEQMQQQQEQIKKAIPEQREALASHPDMQELNLRDPEKLKAWKSDITSYATSMGFTADDVNQVLDHRILVLAEKARRWDDLQNNRKPAAQKKLAKVPKVAKPGARAETQTKPKADRSPAEILYGSA